MKLTITNLLLVALALAIFGTMINLGRRMWSLEVAQPEIVEPSSGSSLLPPVNDRRDSKSIGSGLGPVRQRSGDFDTSSEERTDAEEALIDPDELVVDSNTLTEDSTVADPTAEEILVEEEPELFLATTPGEMLGSGEDLVPLTTVYPEPLFEGIKGPIEVENLEPIEREQDPLFVPPGLTNLATGKAVYSSDALPVIGDLSYITDGNKEGADGNYVELGPRKQWVQIDLEEPSQLFGIWLWHYHKSPRAYLDMVVQVSNDVNFADGSEVIIYNADHDNTSGFGRGSDNAYVDTFRGRVIDAKGITARHVRLYSNGNTANAMNHYTEVEIWGKD